MKPEEVQKLLGGYATGTLTDVEQQALFEAALHDQALFDALVHEQPLRELLRDPAARAELLAALEPAPRGWWNWRPAAAVLSMAAVAVAVVALVLVRRPHSFMVPPRPVPEVAQVAPPAAPAAPLAATEAPRAYFKRRQKATAAPRPSFSASLGLQTADSAPAGGGGGGSSAPHVSAAPAPAQLETADATAQARGALGGAPPIQPQAQTSMFAPETPAEQTQIVRMAPRMAVAPASARALFFGANPRPALARAALAGAIVPGPVLAVRYSILRRNAAGNFVEAAPGDIGAADTLALRITANTGGTLSIGDAAPAALAAMAPYTTPPLPAGQSEVRMVFTTAQPPATEPLTVETPLTESSGSETFVANRLPGGWLRFTVRLPF